MEFFNTSFVPYFNYWIYVILMMIGLYAMITKNNLIKKLIGMTIFQTAIILFYVSIGVKEGADIPILHHEDEHAEVAVADGTENETGHGDSATLNPDRYANPLPHVLMLTAIVVGVSTLGVALAVCQSLFREFGTLEENEILEKIKQGGGDVDV